MGYILATTVAGKTKEIEKYYDYRNNRGTGESRQKKSAITPEAKAMLNDKQAVKTLRRLMNENFNNDSWYLTMDCIKEKDHDYATPEEMKDMLARFQRKCRSYWKKHGSDLKYVSVMAIGARSARHFHLVLSGCNGVQYKEMREALQRIWDEVYMTDGKRRSYIHLENLYGENYGDLAAYFVKQSNTTREAYGDKIGKRWNSSRNLVKPVTKKQPIVNRKAFLQEVKAPKGWHIDAKYTERGIGCEEYGGYEFVRYILIRDQDRRKHER